MDKQNPKTCSFFKLVVQCSTYKGCIMSCCTKLSNSKAVFEHILPVGCYLQAVSLLLLSMGRSQWQVFCFWHSSALEFMGFFLFSVEDFIKCCYSSLYIVNNPRLKHKRRKEFLLPADSEQKEYIILMLIAEKNDALYGTIYCYNKEKVADKTSCSLICHWQ